MKIAILHGPRDLRIEDRPLDTGNLKPEEIWVQTRISALKIGTDRGNYEGAERVPGAPDYPRWVGDSNLGIVRGVGRDVKNVQVGDRIVTRQPHQSEYITTQTASIVKVPHGVDDEDAVWAHLYALSALCYTKAQFRPGENVAVVGLGVLGLGAVGLGPLFGGRILAIGNSTVRLEMARKMGAHEAVLFDDPRLELRVNEFTGGAGIDLVILTANPWPAYAFHDFPRIGFLLLDQTNVSVVFPTKKIAGFPHAADVIILGCQRDGYIEARWVALPELDTVYSSDPITETCSP